MISHGLNFYWVPANRFTEVTNSLPHLKDKWYARLRQFLCNIGGSLDLQPSFVPPLERDNDMYIMDLILQNQFFSDEEIRQLNNCRLYLMAVTVSDLTNAAGTRLDKHLLHGNRHGPQSSRTTCPHFDHGLPLSESYWILWKTANRLWSDQKGNLYKPLGPWRALRPGERRRRRSWHAYSEGGVLYVRQSSGFHVYLAHGSSGQTFSDVHKEKATVLEVPLSASPVDVIRVMPVPEEWKVESPLPLDTPCLPIATPMNFNSYVGSFDEWERELLELVSLRYDVQTTMAMMMETNFVVACDGSIRHQTDASFGWVLSSPTGALYARCHGPARGFRPTSHRAEAYGMLSIFRFLIRITSYMAAPSKSWKCTIVCDNLRLVQEIQSFVSPGMILDGDQHSSDAKWKGGRKGPLTSDWDIVNELYHNFLLLPGVQIKHVQGHQDGASPYADLSIFAQLNVEADAWAGSYQDLHGEARTTVHLFPHAGVQLNLAQGTITYKIHQAVTEQWIATIHNAIDWKIQDEVFHRHIEDKQLFTDFIQESLPTNEHVHRKIPTESAFCPRCGSVPEDRDHVIKCHHSAEWQESTLIALEKKCVDLRSRPGLLDILLTGLSRWMKDLPPVEASHYPAVYNGVIRTQTMIGWRHLFSGRFSKEWAVLQDDFLRDYELAPDPRHSAGDVWCIQVLAVLWEQWTILWTTRYNSNKSNSNRISVGNVLSPNNDFRIQVKRRLRAFRGTIDRIVDPRVRDEWLRALDLAIPKGSKAVKNLIDQYERNGVVQNVAEKRKKKVSGKRRRSEVVANRSEKTETPQHQSIQSHRSNRGRSKKRKRSGGS